MFTSSVVNFRQISRDIQTIWKKLPLRHEVEHSFRCTDFRKHRQFQRHYEESSCSEFHPNRYKIWKVWAEIILLCSNVKYCMSIKSLECN